MSKIYVIPVGADPEKYMAAAARAGADSIHVGPPPDSPDTIKIPGIWVSLDPAPLPTKEQLRDQVNAASTVAQLREVVLHIIDSE